MRALITGVNGFVGKHLSFLLSKKGFEVYGTDISESTEKINNLSFFKSDITKKEETCEIIKKSNPDMIFHLAAISSPKKCEENPELANNIAIKGTENVLRSCLKNNINPKIVITSSSYVYGVPEYVPIDEKHPTNPKTQYGISKLNQEKIALNFFKEHNLNIIISRSFNHIGPGQALGFVASDFAKQIAEIEKNVKNPEILVGDLTAKRDFTDVKDIVEAYLLLIEKGRPGEIYNIGSGKSYSIQEILDKLISMSTKKIRVIHDKTKKKLDIPLMVADNSKFTALTGWKPKVSIEQSLREILDYWRKII